MAADKNGELELRWGMIILNNLKLSSKQINEMVRHLKLLFSLIFPLYTIDMIDS